MISEIVANGPASRAELQKGDVLLDFAGESVSGVDHLHRLLTADRVDLEIPVRVLRRGKLVELTVRPAAD
jgi:S1-C subfamily serine protease